MPRTKGLNGLPIHKRKGYWICYVKLADGTRRERALHLRADGSRESERAAVSSYWQEQARATSGRDAGQRTKATLSRALQALNAEQELAGVKEDALRSTTDRGRCLVRHFGADCDLSQLTAANLVAYATEARKLRAPLTVRMELGVLTRAMRALDVPVPRKPKVHGGAKPQEPLTPQQVRMFWAALGPRHKLLGLVFLTLGPRLSEVAKIDEIDWKKRLLHIAGTKTDGADRWVPIPPELWEHMEALCERCEWAGFPRMSDSHVGKVLSRACKRAGIGTRSSNDFRGTWSTNATLAGLAPEIRAAIQGNSPTQQLKTYSQPGTRPDELHDAVKRGVPRVAQPSVKYPSADGHSTDDLAPPTPITSAKTLRKSSADAG